MAQYEHKSVIRNLPLFRTLLIQLAREFFTTYPVTDTVAWVPARYEYTHTASHPLGLPSSIWRKSVEVTDGEEIFTDNGSGVMVGDKGGSGSVDYDTGYISVRFVLPPINDITISYEIGEGRFLVEQNNEARRGLSMLLTTDQNRVHRMSVKVDEEILNQFDDRYRLLEYDISNLIKAGYLGLKPPQAYLIKNNYPNITNCRVQRQYFENVTTSIVPVTAFTLPEDKENIWIFVNNGLVRENEDNIVRDYTINFGSNEIVFNNPLSGVAVTITALGGVPI